jgi:4-amino-4-deoxy-L-arabinose transferase-like glycosyltransferase
LLAVCWFGTWFVFWTVCKTKLPHYLLPAYPALALLTACFVERWVSEPKSVAWWALRNAWVSTVLVGVAIAAAVLILVYFPKLTGLDVSGLQSLALIGLILVIGGVWCWRETLRGQNQRAAIGFATMSVVFLAAAFGPGSIVVDRLQNTKPMIAAIQRDWKEVTTTWGILEIPFTEQLGHAESMPPPIATYLFFRESTVFYAGYPMTRCEDDPAQGRTALQQIGELRSKSPVLYIITNDDDDHHVAQLIKAYPGRLHEIFRQRRFLGPGDMVILRSGEALQR